jgi:dUTP pyrophosphatase
MDQQRDKGPTMLIYLSHPIDRSDGIPALKIKLVNAQICKALETSQHHLFQPGQAFYVPEYAQMDQTIERINQTAQRNAQGVIVVWPQNAKSWGVPVEVERALKNNQPVAFLTDSKPTWAMPAAWTDSDLFKTFGFKDYDIYKALEWLDQKMVHNNHQEKTLPYKLLTYTAQKPTRAYDDDAGFDLYVSQTTTIEPGQFVDIPCSIAVELESDTWALLTGRSSTLRKHGLMVNQGIIDPGYRGELYAGVWNLSTQPVTIYAGDRVAQLILMPNWTSLHKLQEVETLTPHPRGENGFGSSGR